MIFAVLFILLLVVLAFLARHTINALYQLFYNLTHSHKAAIYLISVVFFPGTLIHELSHMIMAGILLVHVGEINLIPEIEGHSVKLGTAEIGVTDPLRRSLIGVAPVIFGTLLILMILFLFSSSFVLGSADFSWWKALIISYFLFVIGNNMFSSKKDLEGVAGTVIAFVAIAALIYILLYVLPLNGGAGLLGGPTTLLQTLPTLFGPGLTLFFRHACGYLMFPILLDILVVITARALNKRIY